MVTSTKNVKIRNDNWREHRKRVLIFLAATVVFLIVLFDLSGIGGNVRFYGKWIECGHRPVVTNPGGDFGGGSVQDYAQAPTFKLVRKSPVYYCSPIEAERAGFSADPNYYSFPHLEKQ